MGNSTFRGGAHPYEGKELSMDTPIRVMMPKDELVFPMSQHIGAPATPTVSVVDTVKMGQIIGEARGFISANIVSSVSGKVTKIEPRLTVSGAKATCVVIENDGYILVGMGDADVGRPVFYIRLAVVVMVEIHLLLEHCLKQCPYGKLLLAERFTFDV